MWGRVVCGRGEGYDAIYSDHTIHRLLEWYKSRFEIGPMNVSTGGVV